MRIAHRQIDRALDDIKGAATDLIVDASDIFTKYAYGGELHTADKQHQNGDGRDTESG